jgi:hypothetical protein
VFVALSSGLVLYALSAFDTKPGILGKGFAWLAACTTLALLLNARNKPTAGK